ncbi:uncharacterized protein LOC128724112 [Anopheles nili]|uniref:uncharacterized protein LOC128724112 n=1 Tax=Anopheles nili TaxID=185578 RepID=UPI00237AABE5|nr:uncharacterized protein LOC128724112 [Anopheles nili]
MESKNVRSPPSKKPFKLPPKLTPKMWKRDEVLAFLHTYEETIHHPDEDCYDNEEDIWNSISHKLNNQGIEVSADHCKSKWNLLYKTYLAKPNREGTFFEIIKRIVDVPSSSEEHIEVAEVCPTKEDVLMLDERSDDESHGLDESTEKTIHSVSMTIEKVVDSPVRDSSSLRTLIEALCYKIDLLTEQQQRQEKRIEEVYQLQKGNQLCLLEIKKCLDIP